MLWDDSTLRYLTRGKGTSCKVSAVVKRGTGQPSYDVVTYGAAGKGLRQVERATLIGHEGGWW